MSLGLSDPSDAPELYKLVVLEEDWEQIRQRVLEEPTEARYVDNNNTTALHLAVKARSSHGEESPGSRLSAIRSLMEAYPDAAYMTAGGLGLTPLSCACMTTNDDIESLKDDALVVDMLLQQSPKCLNILTREEYSPLDLHIMCFSKVKSHSSMFSSNKSSSKPGSTTAVLNALLEAQDFSNGEVAKTLELLVDCNSLEILDNVALEEAEASSSKLQARRLARSSGHTGVSVCPTASTNFAHFWVWEWALLILMEYHNQKHEHSNNCLPPFRPMHVAAQVKDCPLPFLMLAMRAYPEDVRFPDETTGNLPLHDVAAWDSAGDQSSVSRKSMSLSALVSEYPEATKMRNKEGKTPMSLALDTGTSWDSGMRKLTACQKAVVSPARSQTSY